LKGIMTDVLVLTKPRKHKSHGSPFDLGNSNGRALLA
jgi:hypothetical protein